TSFQSAILNNCNFSGIRPVKSFSDYIVDAFLNNGPSVMAAALTDDPNISDFTWTELKNADFSDSYIVGFNFLAALLHNANFTACSINKCSFWISQTRGADFDQAKFTQSVLHDFTEVENLSCTTMDSTTWKTVDWNTVKDTTIPKPIIDNKNHY
ncbi:MAG: pentapeptide repeat-containing protein, partial [Owenweeksia sp.]